MFKTHIIFPEETSTFDVSEHFSNRIPVNFLISELNCGHSDVTMADEKLTRSPVFMMPA